MMCQFFMGLWIVVFAPAQVTSNDVMAVWRVLGVEAARATLVREVRAVFGAYGIAVDPRHLGLIADYMMHQVSVLVAGPCFASMSVSLFAPPGPHVRCSTCIFF